MSRLFACLAAAFVANVGVAFADPAVEWNEAARAIARMDASGDRPPNPALRAQVALAIFEAANAADPRYGSYVGLEPAQGPVSADAAVAQAAHDVLVRSAPGQAKPLAASLAFDLAAIPDGPAEQAGLALGKRAAAKVLERALLNETPAPDYRPAAQPGVYVPTDLPILPMQAYVGRPWFLTRPDEVMPPAPPALTSARYAKDFDEVRRVGAKTSSERTPAQTAAANFWAGNESDLALRLLIERRPGRSLVQNARFYALLSMAAQDAGLAMAIAKYDNAFWRPITAIRNADKDGNPKTAMDPAWEPLLRTPLHPEYPCGHCIGAAVTATMVAAEFGETPEGGLLYLDPGMPGAAYTAASTEEYVQAVSDSRIYAGVHYRFSNEAAVEMGRRIARLALERGMRPLQPTG